ncbi:MAG: hypothetical protein U0930_07590 [Pirellulales bacterium]
MFAYDFRNTALLFIAALSLATTIGCESSTNNPPNAKGTQPSVSSNNPLSVQSKKSNEPQSHQLDGFTIQLPGRFEAQQFPPDDGISLTLFNSGTEVDPDETVLIMSMIAPKAVEDATNDMAKFLATLSPGSFESEEFSGMGEFAKQEWDGISVTHAPILLKEPAAKTQNASAYGMIVNGRAIFISQLTRKGDVEAKSQEISKSLSSSFKVTTK